MNARQKAKYYKKKYEETKEKPIPKFTVSKYKVDTLKTKKLCPKDLIENNDEITDIDIVTRALAQVLASQADKYMTITTNYEPSLHSYIVNGEIKVVSNY